MATERQIESLPPAQPSYILRGHASQIHSVQFLRHNSRLLTGDADGWLVFWKVDTKRPLAVWKAHDGAILGTAEWGSDRVITHGRDNALRIWQLRATDESALSTILPAEQTAEPRPKPWLQHTLPVNTLNFCAFSICRKDIGKGEGSSEQVSHEGNCHEQSQDAILIAVPSTDDKKIDVYGIPDERLRFVVPKVQPIDTGMVMAVKLVHHKPSQNILVLSGYEGGITAIHRLPVIKGNTSVGIAELVYLSKPHAQPILSLDVSPDATKYFTSSADAVVAAHKIPELASEVDEQEDLAAFQGQEPDEPAEVTDVASESLIDAQERTTTSSDPETTNILSQSQSSQDLQPLSFPKRAPLPPQPSTLSSLLATSTTTLQRIRPPAPTPPPTTLQPPLKSTDTKHSGQQSLCVRSDGRLLVTGGWDSRVRIYSAKTLKEVAVLKWHKEGVYAVDFAEILDDTLPAERAESQSKDGGDRSEGDNEEERGAVKKAESGLARLQRRREEAVQRKHWVAAGAKDGRVSLWEVF